MILRRNFITLLGGAAVWPLTARAQRGDRVRRIGVLMPFDENDPDGKRRYSAFTQALAGLGWVEGRNVRMYVRWGGMTSIGCERSRRSWSACNCCCKLLSTNVFLAQGESVPYNFPYKWQTRRRTLADKSGRTPLPAGAGPGQAPALGTAAFAVLFCLDRAAVVKQGLRQLCSTVARPAAELADGITG